VCRATLRRGVGIKAGAGAREKCFLKFSPVVQSQQLMLLFSWGLGRYQEVVRPQRNTIRHKHAYLPIARKSEEATWQGMCSGLASTHLRPNSVHDGDGLLKWRLSKCGCGPFAALQLPAGRRLLLVAS